MYVCLIYIYVVHIYICMYACVCMCVYVMHIIYIYIHKIYVMYILIFYRCFSHGLQNPVEFKLLGIIIGIALYNNVILDVHFPKAVYKKAIK